MLGAYKLEFHPYYGEGVSKDFVYIPKYKQIIDFFDQDAQKCIDQLVSKAFVIKYKGKIVGYTALSLKSIAKPSLTRRKQAGLFDRPAVVIGQLIIDAEIQKKGFGKATIEWVIFLIKFVQKFFPVRLLVVDALDEEAARYYQHLGFQSLKKDPLTLVLDLLPILRKR